jgi:CBS domain-containing protein
MKTTMVTVRPNARVQEVARQMRTHNVGFVPVCNEHGKVEGVVTDRDIACRVVADGRSVDAPVSECMSSEHIVTLHPDDDLARVQQEMGAHRVSRVLVCDDHGVLKGVVSLSDVAQVADPSQCAHTLKRVTSREYEPA